MDTAPVYVVDEPAGDGLRYTEVCEDSYMGWSSRKAELWLEGDPKPVSSTWMHAFRLRFGSVSVPVEGYGGVSTRADYRRRGYNRILLQRSQQHVRQRVDAVFLFGVERLYPKYGFVPCLAEGDFKVREVRCRQLEPAEAVAIRQVEMDECAKLVRLYNEANADRPLTVDRDLKRWRRYRPDQTWTPAARLLLAERKGRPCGYAVMDGHGFGREGRAVNVQELWGRDDRTVTSLLCYIGAICREAGRELFTVHEPPDNRLGRMLRRIGCEYTWSYSPDGGGMGCILNREGLLWQLEPEMMRRSAGRVSDDLWRDAWKALREGRFIPDDCDLLTLLIGYVSWREFRAGGGKTFQGRNSGEVPAETAEAWFPGGGSASLRFGFSHYADRY